MRRLDVRAADYRESVAVLTYSAGANDFVQTSTMRAAVKQTTEGPQGVQNRVAFRTRYREDIGTDTMLLWRGTKYFVAHALDEEMRHREITILANNGIPAVFSPAASGMLSAKSVNAAALGDTTISLGTLATGLADIAIGDTFRVSPYSVDHVATNAVTAAAGEIDGVTFTPALTGDSPALATVSVNKLAKSYNLYVAVDSYAANEINGAQIMATDVKVLVLKYQLVAAGYSLTPLAKDTITLNGRQKTVVTANSIFNDGGVVAFELQCR